MTIARVLVAPYPFKGTLGPADAAAAIAEGIARFSPRIISRLIPLADGGTGTLDAFMAAHGGSLHRLTVPHATGRLRSSRWGLTGAGVAVAEAAECIALAGVPVGERDPGALTTIGLGHIILHALGHHPSSLIIGLGDTATHDCGLGVGAALGYRFLDRAGAPLPAVGASLRALAAIDPSGAAHADPAVPLRIFCDVLNPLTGPDGAALRFAGQKGGDERSIDLLEEGGFRFIEVVARDLGAHVGDIPGAGAAGGLGAGLMAFLGGCPEGGADALLAAAAFPAALADADLVITGEGRLDARTLLGKGVGRVARMAADAGVRLMVIAGSVEGERSEWERRLGATIIELGVPDTSLSPAERLAYGAVRGLGLLNGDADTYGG